MPSVTTPVNFGSSTSRMVDFTSAESAPFDVGGETVEAHGLTGLVLGDAFGSMMLAAYSPNADLTSILGCIEREDGSVHWIPADSYIVNKPIDERALDLAHGRVLDVGCGSGRHSSVLGRRGNSVTALDISEGCIELCAQLPGVTAHLGSIETVCLERRKFDTVMLLGNNVGLAGLTSNLDSFLGQISDLLAPHGTLLATSTIQPLVSNSEDEEYSMWNLRRGRAAGDVHMRFRFGRLATNWFDYALIDPTLLVAAIEKQGMRVMSIEYFPPHYLLVAQRK